VLLVAGCSSGGSASQRGPSAAPSVDVPADARSTPYERAVLADRPVGYWPLNAPTTSRDPQFPDASGHVAQAVVLGDVPEPTRGPDLAGVAVRGQLFRAHTALVTPLQPAYTTTTALTMEVWLRPDAGCPERWQHVLGTGTSSDGQGDDRDGIEVLHYPADRPGRCGVGFEVWSEGTFRGGCATPQPIRKGEWTHFAVTYAGGTARCFADGTLVNTGSVGAFTNQAAIPLRIGGSGTGYGGPLVDVALAQVAIYDRALTPQQLARHAQVAAGR
jgi:hypothetical protein